MSLQVNQIRMTDPKIPCVRKGNVDFAKTFAGAVELDSGETVQEKMDDLSKAMEKMIMVGYIFTWDPVSGSTQLDTAQKVHDYFGFGTWQQITDTFLLGAGPKHAVGSTGGEENHTLVTAEMPNHDHGFTGTAATHNHSFTGTQTDLTVDNHTHTGTTDNGGVAHTHSVNALTGTAASSGGTHSHTISDSGGKHNHDIGSAGTYIKNTGVSLFRVMIGTGGAAAGFLAVDHDVLPEDQKTNLSTGTLSDISSSGAHGHTISGNGAHGHSVSISAFNTNNASAYSHTHAFTTGSGGGFTTSITPKGSNADASITPSGSISGTGSDVAHNNMPPYKTVYIWKRIA